MKTYEEYKKRSRPGRAFPNGSEWELWQYTVCLGRGSAERSCVNDVEPELTGGCPLILLKLDDRTPAEWRIGGAPGCSEKTTPVEARRAAREAEEAAEKAAIEAEHYPMFGAEQEATP